MPSPAARVRGLAVLGTGSDVGKSFVATALCRVLADRGVRVAPFKAQNMSNNAGVTRDGLEMARAQIVQAAAARVEPEVDMNPVLVKPSSATGAQVIVRGRVLGTREAGAYLGDGPALRDVAMASLAALSSRFEALVVEGAGSCAEVNLRARDFANMDVAHAADLPVLLVADIDRGGVFAQVMGTLAVLDARDRARVRAIVVNRFRGDPRLFDDGRAWLQRNSGLPVLGVLPYRRDIQVESEDALPPEASVDPGGPLPRRDDAARVGVILAPHVANFTDFAPLAGHPEVDLHFLSRPRDLAPFDWILLPGSKNTRGDLEHLHRSGWARRVVDWHDAGGHLWGVCGGYQVMGTEVADPLGVEGEPGSTPGLGLLDAVTTLARDKRLGRSEGTWQGVPVRGYEIHHGRTVRRSGDAALVLRNRPEGAAHEQDGATSASGRAVGSYLHGIFDEPRALAAMLSRVRPDLDFSAMADRAPFSVTQDAAYDQLAAWFLHGVDTGELDRLLERGA